MIIICRECDKYTVTRSKIAQVKIGVEIRWPCKICQKRTAHITFDTRWRELGNNPLIHREVKE